MKKNWKDYIESLNDLELFNYLTIDRGDYQKEGIIYAEEIIKKRGISLIELQKKNNYGITQIKQEIEKRIKSGEDEEFIKENFNTRELNEYIYLIKEEKNNYNKKSNKKKRKSKITFNIVLSLLYSFGMFSKVSSPNFYQVLAALTTPIITPFIFGTLFDFIKSTINKDYKFKLFSDLFLKTWFYFVLFLWITLIISKLNN